MSVSFSERRASVRLLQVPSSENDALDTTSAVASRRASFYRRAPTPSPVSIRRRSSCLPLSSTEEAAPDSPDSSCAGSFTAPTSPAPPSRRATNPDGSDALLSSPNSPRPPGNCPDSPHHLSVPLTLLSLHNGGTMRHSPRTAGLAQAVSFRELGGAATGHSTSSPGIPTEQPSDAASWSPARAGSMARTSLDPCGGGGSGGGSCPSPPQGPSPRPPPQGLSPRRLTSFVGTAAPPSPTPMISLTAGGSAGSSSAAAAAAAPPSPGRIPSCATLMPSPLGALTAAAAATAAGAGGASASAATAAGTTATTTTTASLSVPSHLSIHRPPTPVCKEDDLLLSMRHMSSPSRRRSRFASAADSPLLAAAAAAIAAEEAGLLGDSPPRAAAAGDAGPSRRTSVTFHLRDFDGVSEVAGSGGGAGPAGLGGAGEAPGCFIPGALGGGGIRAPGSMSASWRSTPPLMTVPEEVLPSRSRVAARPASQHAAAGGDSTEQSRSLNGAAAVGRSGDGRGGGSEPADDSLSSFMHSLGPAGVPAGAVERRCPLASREGGFPAGQSALGGRIPAR